MTDPKRLSIIVPYRDRAEHLSTFVGHMLTYFSRDKLDRHTPYKITIVEQFDDGLFNRGKLSNIGFDLTKDAFDYFCFHDVDFLPIWADYRYPDKPTRIIWHGADVVPYEEGDSVKINHDYERYFGGVVLFTKEHFQRINGYSNAYEGWGFEDNDLRVRCEEAGLGRDLRDGTFRPLHHKNTGMDRTLKFNDVAKANNARFDKRIKSGRFKDIMQEDGLSDLSYTVVYRDFLKNRRSEGEIETIELVQVQFA